MSSPTHPTRQCLTLPFSATCLHKARNFSLEVLNQKDPKTIATLPKAKSSYYVWRWYWGKWKSALMNHWMVVVLPLGPWLCWQPGIVLSGRWAGILARGNWVAAEKSPPENAVWVPPWKGWLCSRFPSVNFTSGEALPPTPESKPALRQSALSLP